jgi:hypothetical protein
LAPWTVFPQDLRLEAQHMPDPSGGAVIVLPVLGDDLIDFMNWVFASDPEVEIVVFDSVEHTVKTPYLVEN